MASSYVTRAACHGQRPASFRADSGYQRPHLISRLLKERDVTRVIVAPFGYGKSLLAVDYGETVFGWEHVFWFNAKSPCFIRDVDAGTLASACLEFDEDAALVVFDDVPWLDDARTKQFSHQIDELLKAGCEVMVTSAPACKLSGSFQRDRLELNAFDLLLSDEELGGSQSPLALSESWGSDIPSYSRIASLVWGAQGEGVAAGTFRTHLLDEELPSDLQGVVVTMMVLARGTMDSLRELVPVDDESLASLRSDYPHLGISDDLASFRCLPVDIDDLLSLSRGTVDDVAARVLGASRGDLVDVWARCLLKQGMAERACDLLVFLGTNAYNTEWCLAHRHDIVAQACFYALFPLLLETGRATLAVRAKLDVLKALGYQVLGEKEAALKIAKRLIQDASAEDEQRAWASMIACKVGSTDEVRLAMNCLQQLDVKAMEISGEVPSWQLLTRLKCACDEGLFEAVEMWEVLAESGAHRDVLCIGAAWIFDLYRNVQVEGAHAQGVDGLLVRVERSVRAALLECDGAPDFFAASAGLALESAHARGLAYAEGPLEASVLLALRQVEMHVLAQRGKLSRKLRENQEKRSEWARLHPSAMLQEETLPQLRVEQRVPQLTLRLFGSFEAMMGDESIDRQLNRRRNARTLLAMLAVNGGKEMPRDSLARVMWPDSDVSTARKNFYTVWGYLRQVLTLPDGTCPYLVRHQYGCSLEQRHVRSDIDRFSELCRELLFGPAERSNWLTLYTEINRDFSNELLPGETRNALIMNAREKLKSHLVDALVSACANVMEAGQPQWGVYFAREAVDHDDTREDAYVALMRAQIASQQRTSAMMTYLRCQKVLSDQLGIDPSPETEAIYEDLLSSGVEVEANANV